MAGTSLACEGFIESQGFEISKADLCALHELSDQDIDERLDALLWALRRDPSSVSEHVGERNLWVAVEPGSTPPLRIFLRPREGVPTDCELLWIEERL